MEGNFLDSKEVKEITEFYRKVFPEKETRDFVFEFIAGQLAQQPQFIPEYKPIEQTQSERNEFLINLCKDTISYMRFSFDKKNRKARHFIFSSFTIKHHTKDFCEIYVYGNYISPTTGNISSPYCLIFRYKNWRMSNDVRKERLDGNSKLWLPPTGEEYLYYDSENDKYKVMEGGMATKAAR